MAHGFHAGQVQVGIQNRLFFVGPAEHCAPGVHGDGVSIRHIAAALVPGGGTAQGEALVVHRPLAEQQLPVGGAGGHVKGRRDDDSLTAPQAHTPGELFKAQVKADAQAHQAEFRVKGGDLVPGGQRVRLHKALASRHVDVEQMDLPVRSPAMWEKLKFFSKKRWSVLIFVILLRQMEMASWSISNPKHQNIIYLSICTI